MLLLAVMVFMPVADAFSCSLESEQTHASEFSANSDQGTHDESGSGEENPSDVSHDVCVHNHCHHTTADLPPQPEVGAFFLKADGPHPIDDANLLAKVSDEFIRPPRI